MGGLAIFHKPFVYEGLWKIAKSHKFGFSFSKQRIPEIFQMQLFSTGPVVHLRDGFTKKVAFLLDFVRITSPPPSPQFGQRVPLF